MFAARKTCRPTVAGSLPLQNGLTIEEFRGHFFELTVFKTDGDSPEITGGELRLSEQAIEISREHAVHLTDKLRAQIDACLTGSIMDL
jgi:hypothetical protein